MFRNQRQKPKVFPMLIQGIPFSFQQIKWYFHSKWNIPNICIIWLKQCPTIKYVTFLTAHIENIEKYLQIYMGFEVFWGVMNIKSEYCSIFSGNSKEKAVTPCFVQPLKMGSFLLKNIEKLHRLSYFCRRAWYMKKQKPPKLKA